MKTFEEIYNTRPDKAEVGSSGYSNLKNLYDICERLQPELIVESGHWKSNSAYLFHHFCQVISYDIQFDTALYENETIERVKEDIESKFNIAVEVGSDLPIYLFGTGGYVADASNTLFYFDDHISHLQRLKFLVSIEAKYAVFDDNNNEEVCKTLKNPPSPTLQTMLDRYTGGINETLEAIKKYEVLPFYGNKRNFDTKLTYIEL